MADKQFVSWWADWFCDRFCSLCNAEDCCMNGNPHVYDNSKYLECNEYACELFDLMARSFEIESTPQDPDEPEEVTFALEKEFVELDRAIADIKMAIDSILDYYSNCYYDDCLLDAD